jgi:hypothetical protein
MKSGELVYQRTSERATTSRNYNKLNFQLSRKAPIPLRVLSPKSPEGAGPASKMKNGQKWGQSPFIACARWLADIRSE